MSADPGGRAVALLLLPAGSNVAGSTDVCLSVGIAVCVSERGQIQQSPSTPTVRRWKDVKTRKKVNLGARVLCAAASTLSVCGSSVWYRQHDLLGARVRTVLRGGARHQMSQRAAGADARHPDGLHLHTDVLHLSEQRG